MILAFLSAERRARKASFGFKITSVGSRTFFCLGQGVHRPAGIDGQRHSVRPPIPQKWRAVFISDWLICCIFWLSAGHGPTLPASDYPSNMYKNGELGAIQAATAQISRDSRHQPASLGQRLNCRMPLASKYLTRVRSMERGQIWWSERGSADAIFMLES